MNKLVLVAAMSVGSLALACGHHGSHGHGGNGIALRLGHLALDLRFGIRPEPCQEAVVVAQAAPVEEEYEAPPVIEAPPPVYVEPEAEYCPPPVVEAPPTVYVAPPRVHVAAPVVVVAPAVVEEPRPGPALIALKYMPGMSSTVAFNNDLELGGLGFSQSVGVEVRLGRYFALRSDGELRPNGRSWDVVGAKLSLFPSSNVRPYGSVSLSVSDTAARPGQILLGVMGAGGLDIAIGRHFFIEGEVRYRRLPNNCCSEDSQVTALIGAGVAFF